MELLNPQTLDPNLIYLALVVGLWVGVTAVYMAGSGVPELISIVLLVGSIAVLTQLPTNWWAVVVLVLGVSAFLVLPFIFPRHAAWAELGLALQAGGGLFMFSDRAVSPVVIVITVVLAWLYHRFILMPVIRAYRQRSAYDDATEVMGARGRVIKRIDPVGTVSVQGEHWTARSEDPLEVDTEIVVVEQRGLELRVEKAKRDFVEPEPIHRGNGAH